jgi:cysteine-rich repeat protein
MRSKLLVLGIVAALAACNVPLVTFSVGDTQPPQEDCNAVGDEDGNGLADCADPACAGTPACKLVKLVCGNGVIDPGEECDPGVMDSANCNSNRANQIQTGLGCMFSKCGDGYSNSAASEQCDSGGQITAACIGSRCTLSRCGDGFVNSAAGEQCDDGNNNNSDACPDGPGGTCRVALCGDGFVEIGIEECDAGNVNSDTIPNACRTNCRLPFCGDGVVDLGEVCDGASSCTGGKTCNSSCSSCI